MAEAVKIPLYLLIEHDKDGNGSSFTGVYGSAEAAQAAVAQEHGDSIEWARTPSSYGTPGEPPSYHAGTPGLAWYLSPCALEAKGSLAFDAAILRAAAAILQARYPRYTQPERDFLETAATGLDNQAANEEAVEPPGSWRSSPS